VHCRFEDPHFEHFPYLHALDLFAVLPHSGDCLGQDLLRECQIELFGGLGIDGLDPMSDFIEAQRNKHFFRDTFLGSRAANLSDGKVIQGVEQERTEPAPFLLRLGDEFFLKDLLKNKGLDEIIREVGVELEPSHEKLFEGRKILNQNGLQSLLLFGAVDFRGRPNRIPTRGTKSTSNDSLRMGDDVQYRATGVIPYGFCFRQDKRRQDSGIVCVYVSAGVVGTGWGAQGWAVDGVAYPRNSWGVGRICSWNA
jgi:hypothetical protein